MDWKAGLEDDGFGGLASDSPAAGEANQFETLQQKITDLQAFFTENPAVSGDGLDLFGVGDVAVVATSDSVPVQDFFGGDTDFGGSGSVEPLDAPAASASVVVNGDVDLDLDPLKIDAPVDVSVSAAEMINGGADVLLDHPLDAAPVPQEVSGSGGNELVEAAPQNIDPVDGDLGGAEDIIDLPGPFVVVDSINPSIDSRPASTFEISDAFSTTPIAVNGDVSPPESEVAPTQKTLLWREEQLKKIAEKDKNEEAKLEEWRNTAKRELEEWYARQAEQVEKHKKNNRVAEAEFVKERDETTPGNEWERISRLCDFNPKNNKNTKDVSKLRSLLLQLKQNPIARSSTA